MVSIFSVSVSPSVSESYLYVRTLFFLKFLGFRDRAFDKRFGCHEER